MFFSHAVLGNPDCGLNAHKALVRRTEALIERKEELRIMTPEMASGNGKFECVRFEFQIDKQGNAINLLVKDSTKELLMNLAAADALKKYKFHPSAGGTKVTYTLVFSGIVGAAPPYP